MEIAVANLWPNRLIGDQSLPPEKRLTWTTWNPFKKDSPLLESGLLGPVSLVAEKEVPVGKPKSGQADSSGAGARAGACTIVQDAAGKLVTMADAGSNLVLRLNCDGRCLLDRVIVRGREVVAPETGVCSAIQVSNQWFTTRSGIPSPKVAISRNNLTVRDIVYGGGGVQVKETWRFIVHADRIDWQIDRDYLSGGRLDDTYFPGWDFKDMATWTGGMLDNGGVAWNKYLETPNATYGAHANAVTFWNREKGDCLRIADVTPRQPSRPPSSTMAMRFSHQPSGIEAVAFSVTDIERRPKHNLCRFLSSRQDLWAPFEIQPGKTSAKYSLQALGL